MLSIQTNIALQLVATLSKEEMDTFAIEFNKLHQPVANCKPKKQNEYENIDPQVLAQQILKEHRHKNASQCK